MIAMIRRIYDKLNAKISVQLLVSFIGMFILIFLLGSLLIYWKMESILRANSESNIVKQFQQNQYNISTFVNQVDLLSRQLATDSQMLSLFNNQAAASAEQVMQNRRALALMSNTIANFQFIDSIVYYGINGLALKAAPNQNIVRFDKNGSGDKFYMSESGDIFRSNNLRLIWFGGYTDGDFGLYPLPAYPSAAGDRFYMSAARLVNAQSEMGILALNIDMDYFSSIYNHLKDSQTEKIYMINSAGIIISAGDHKEIGKQSALYRQIDADKAVQSFTVTDGNETKQVVYFRLGIADWILADEIPVSVIEKDISDLQVIFLGILLASFLLAAAISRFWIYKLTKPLQALTLAMKKMGEGSLGLKVETKAKNELGVLSDQFNSMSLSIRDLMYKNTQAQEEKRVIEMKALRAQINPHFIYNTLNTIKWMAVIQKADNVAESLKTFSDYLRPIFKSGDSVCALSDEVAYTLNYIKILNYRYTGAYKVNADIPGEILACKVPRFILQPLLENCVEHGFSDQNGGIIHISACEEQGNLRIRVADNGIGLSEARIKEITASWENTNSDPGGVNGHIGLSNVHRRIRLQYGSPYGLSIDSKKNAGTVVTLVLPREQLT